MDTPKTVPVPPELLVEGKKVLIALPWYRSACPFTAFSLMAMMDRSKYAVSLNFGDAFIAHSRNKLATHFLETNLEWMWAVDDDMILPWGDAVWFNAHTGLKLPPKFAGVHALDRLISHGKTLVGVTYFGRSPGAVPVFSDGAAMNQELLKRGPRDEIRPVKWVGTGGMLTHRSVFLDIEKTFPQLSRDNNKGIGQYYTSSEHDLHLAVDEVLGICSDVERNASEALREVSKMLEHAKHKSGIHSGLGMGEDVSLCVRAIQSGHIPHIDLGCWAGHVGSAVYPIRL